MGWIIFFAYLVGWAITCRIVVRLMHREEVRDFSADPEKIDWELFVAGGIVGMIWPFVAPLALAYKAAKLLGAFEFPEVREARIKREAQEAEEVARKYNLKMPDETL